MTDSAIPVDLKNQVTLVTGGGRGIGRAIAQALASAGAQVVVTARTGPELEETRHLIERAGGACLCRTMDVADEAQVMGVISEVETRLGRIDVLVNNAGISGAKGMPWEVSTGDWWRTLEVNLRGPFVASKAVIPGMIARGVGRIIMVSSNMAFWPFPVASAYSCSKAALMRLTDNLALGLKDHGIAVFAISPGLVRTAMTQDIPEEFAAQAEWTPIEKSAELCVALASGRADGLTGRFIHASEHDLATLLEREEEILSGNLHTMRLVE
jgi:3-oxoacyl-[acyl-carrier protein] reductase